MPVHANKKSMSHLPTRYTKRGIEFRGHLTLPREDMILVSVHQTNGAFSTFHISNKEVPHYIKYQVVTYNLIWEGHLEQLFVLTKDKICQEVWEHIAANAMDTLERLDASYTKTPKKA